MNNLHINIEKKGKSKPINNVYSFTCLQSKNKSETNYNSTNYNQEKRKISSRKNYKKYLNRYLFPAPLRSAQIH